MKIAVSVLCMTLINPLPTIAALNVVADLGGNDTAPFFDGINRQDKDLNTTKVWRGQPGEAAMLPVVTPELSVGIETHRPLRLPGIGALFLIGDDPASRTWLQMNAAQIKKEERCWSDCQRQQYECSAVTQRVGSRHSDGTGVRE
ncbi:hypothetical protein DaDZ19_06490 [Dickeya ananatis]